MATSRTEMIMEQLRQLRRSSPDVEASAIVSIDGLPIASDLPSGSEEDRVSAMSAAMLSLGERISGELNRGILDQVYIRGDQGYVILMAVGPDAVLTVMCGKEAKTGLVFLDMKRAVGMLERLV